MKKHLILIVLVSTPLKTFGGWTFYSKYHERKVSWGSSLNFYTMHKHSSYSNEKLRTYSQKITPKTFVNVEYIWGNQSLFRTDHESAVAVGAELGFAYRKDGIQVNRIDSDTKVPFGFLKQDIKNLSVTPFLKCTVNQNKKVTFSFIGAIPFSFKAVGNLREHQTDHFHTGFYLKPKNIQVFMNLGVDLTYKTYKKFDVVWGYRYTRGKIRYNNKLFMKVPDTGSSQIHHGIYESFSANGDFALNSRKGITNIHELRLSIIKYF
jgi:hypothetical protein